MWRPEGNFEIAHHAWGDTKSIKYIYNQSGVHSNVTEVLLDAGRDFFRIKVTCSTPTQRQALSAKLKTAQLDAFSILNALDLFFKSSDIPVLMQFMNVVAEIEPKVGMLKSPIAEHCKSGFVPDCPPATVSRVIEATELPKGGETILSVEDDTQSKPYFADLQPQLPGRRRSSSLVKN